MEELSLVIQNPNEGEFLKSIDWNKEEFKKMVAAVTEQYDGLVYTDDQMKMAKEDRAKLNTMKKAISDRRIQIKKAIMEPYTQFEADVKEVVELIDKPIAMIDTQIKDYEEEVKNKKKEKIREHFDKNVGDLKEKVKFEAVFEKRYLNQSVSLKKAREEIDEKLENIRNNIDIIRESYPEDMIVPIMNVYLKEFDMPKASAEAMRLQALAKQEEERLREEALKREREKRVQNAAGEEELPAPQIMPEETVAPEKEQIYEKVVEPVSGVEAPEPPKVYRAAFVVYGTKDQLMNLKEFMIANKIKFGKE